MLAKANIFNMFLVAAAPPFVPAAQKPPPENICKGDRPKTFKIDLIKTF